MMQLVIYLLVLLFFVKPLGFYMAEVYEGRIPFWMCWLMPLERLIYRITHIHSDDTMNWKRYALALLYFNALGILFVYAIERLQAYLPFNAEHFPGVEGLLAFNSA